MKNTGENFSHLESRINELDKRLQKLEGTYEEDVAEGGDLATQ